MSFVSISEAIRLSGVSRATFYNKYLKQGQVTVSKDEKGKKCIDTAELLRVFGKLSGDEPLIQVDSTKNDQKNTIGHDYTALRQQIEYLEQQLKQEISRGEELKNDKHRLEQQVDKLEVRAEKAEVKLLEHLTPPEPTESTLTDETLKAEVSELRKSIKQLTGKKWYEFWR